MTDLGLIDLAFEICLLIAQADETFSYEKCLLREADRERKHALTHQGRFAAAMSSYDRLTDTFENPDEIVALSDGGRGARWIRGFRPRSLTPEEMTLRINAAYQRVYTRDRSLIRVFGLVVRNGNDRETSIAELAGGGSLKLAKRRYFLGLKKILKIFSAQ